LADIKRLIGKDKLRRLRRDDQARELQNQTNLKKK